MALTKKESMELLSGKEWDTDDIEEFMAVVSGEAWVVHTPT